MKIKFTVEKIELTNVFLKAEDGVVVAWPKDKLPGNIHEEEVIFFEIDEEPKNEEQNKDLAKKILNEILHIE